MENKINLTNYDGKMQLEYCFIVLQQTINLYINCWHDSIVGYQLLVFASALYIYIYLPIHICRVDGPGRVGEYSNCCTLPCLLMFGGNIWVWIFYLHYSMQLDERNLIYVYIYIYIHRYLIHLYIVDIWEYTLDISVDMQFPNNISMELNNIWWCTRVLFSHDVHVYIYIYWILWMDVGETTCYI